jgi:hypothetical protein
MLPAYRAPSAPPAQPTIFNMTVDPIQIWDLENIYFSFCVQLVVRFPLPYFLSVKPPKHRERYTITNKPRLLIYTSMYTFLHSHLECSRSKTF